MCVGFYVLLVFPQVVVSEFSIVGCEWSDPCLGGEFASIHFDLFVEFRGDVDCNSADR